MKAATPWETSKFCRSRLPRGAAPSRGVARGWRPAEMVKARVLNSWDLLSRSMEDKSADDIGKEEGSPLSSGGLGVDVGLADGRGGSVTCEGELMPAGLHFLYFLF